MTALIMDGFDHYGAGATGAANMLDGVWAQVQNGIGPGVPAWGVRTGAFSLEGNSQNSPYRLVVPGGAKTKIFVSFGYSVDGLPLANTQNLIAAFCTSGNTAFANLWCQADGSLLVTNGAGATLAATQGPVIVSRNWHFIEIDFDPTGGNFVLRVDDATASDSPAINASGVTYTSATVGQIRLIDSNGGGSTPQWLDDLFLRDTAGTVNNSWLGDRRVACLLADDDTTVAGWDARYYKMLGAGILNNVNGVNNGPGVSSPTSTSLNIGAGDFTIEGFARFQALPGGTSKATIFSRWDANNNQRSYEFFLGSQSLNAGSLCFQTSTDGSNSTVAQPVVYPWTPETDTWYHMAIVRASGELLLFVDGQQLGLPIADSNTYFAGSSPFGIAAEITDSGLPAVVANTAMQGWLDEVRFTNGVARYTSNFTPTTTEFPRGGTDPDWADVVLLAGFDSLIQDESSFGRTLTGLNHSAQQTVSDGPLIGVWSTIGKITPDDNTFAEAAFLPAGGIYTLATLPANTNTVTVGTTDGSTPAVYTWKTALSTAFDVLIDVSLQQSLANLENAINAGPGSGTKYGTGTTSNFDVLASSLPAGQMAVMASTAGAAGNAIASTATGGHGTWGGSTLSGGEDIPGPSEFKVQRPPPLTTIISAVQITQRAFKSDAGLCTINSAFIGPLGGDTVGPTHNPTISPAYYSDIYEEDPDTSAPISPATIINGRIRLNRAT